MKISKEEFAAIHELPSVVGLFLIHAETHTAKEEDVKLSNGSLRVFLFSVTNEGSCDCVGYLIYLVELAIEKVPDDQRPTEEQLESLPHPMMRAMYPETRSHAEGVRYWFTRDIISAVRHYEETLAKAKSTAADAKEALRVLEASPDEVSEDGK